MDARFGTKVTDTPLMKQLDQAAVSFQVVLVVGQSKDIAPINAAGALNYNCPACVTTAIADQIVGTLRDIPSQELVQRLTVELAQLHAIDSLGSGGTWQVTITAQKNGQTIATKQMSVTSTGGM